MFKEGDIFMLFENHVYDKLKIICLYVLPAVATLYFTLASIWDWLPYAEQVVGTIAAVETFLGALLGISTKKFNEQNSAADGTMVVDTTDPEKDIYQLNLNIPISQLGEKDQVVFKVENAEEVGENG